MVNICTLAILLKRGLLRLYVLAYIIILISSSCYASQGINIADSRVLNDPPEIEIKDDTVYYDGQITNESYSAILKIIGTNKITNISINSIGGDVENALKIAGYIKKNELNVTVRSVCASACANYIFIAGKNKFIGADSYLLWHGSINGPVKELEISGDISREEFFQLNEVKQLKIKETKFYKENEVSSKIAFCPQLRQDYRKKFPEKWFSYTPQDMEKFGIRKISFVTTPSQWLMSMRSKHVLFANYCN